MVSVLPVLSVDGGPYNGTTVRLGQTVINLGRAEDNDLVVRGPSVSKYHAAIVFLDAAYFLQDVGSTNGTYVNGRDIGKANHRLRQGDDIRLGTSKISVVFRSDEVGTVSTRQISSEEQESSPARLTRSLKAVKPGQPIIDYLERYAEGADWDAIETVTGQSGQFLTKLVAQLMESGQIHQRNQRFYAGSGPRNKA